ncbi:MAG: hypothetical protein ACYCPT_13275, partial [Acidimicrobiales bacterium]
MNLCRTTESPEFQGDSKGPGAGHSLVQSSESASGGHIAGRQTGVTNAKRAVHTGHLRTLEVNDGQRNDVAIIELSFEI